MYTFDVSDSEAEYYDELNDYATTERVRMVLFQMLARNQLSQAELMTLAALGLTGLDDFASTALDHDRKMMGKCETIGGKVWSLIRSDFDEQRESAA